MMLIPLYARYLGKIDYSNLVMLQSLFGILAIFLALNSGVFFYYYEYENTKYRRIVLTSWFYFQVAIAVFLIILVVSFSSVITGFFISSESIQMKLAIVLVVVQLFPYIFNNTNINYFRIERKPLGVIKLVILESFLILTLVFLSLHVFNYGLVGVLLCQILARSIVSIVYFSKSIDYVRVKHFSLKLTKKLIMYSWPFIISSVFSWLVISVDKFIGAATLSDKTQVALLALAMQLVLPITVLADMIRMSIGPFVMSVRKAENASKTYQMVYELCVFAASLVVVGVVLISPFLTIVLADRTYLEAIRVIPLMAFAQLILIAANQFCISYNLVKKNEFIMYSIIISGVAGVLINYFFMGSYGFIVSGYSQIISYLLMAGFLLFYGAKVANLNLRHRGPALMVLAMVLFLVIISFLIPAVFEGDIKWYIISCFVFFVGLTGLYFKSQKFKISMVLSALKKNKTL